MQTTFRALCQLCEKLETTTKRTFMVNSAADFLTQLQPEEVEPAVSMILGRPFPKWDHHVLEVSWAMLSDIVKHLTNVDWNYFRQAFSKTGDIGDGNENGF